MTVEVQQDRLTDYINLTRKTYESKLQEFVDIPSVSMDPAHETDITLMAEKAVELLKSLGATAEIIQTKGKPVVLGEFKSNPSDPTVMVYNHIDVQPADHIEWKSHPFHMKIDGDRYLGRGTTDDKGPALSVLYAAKYAYDNKFPINIKFLWELEEEIGSPSFHEFVEKNLAKLKSDSVVVSDTIWISADRPAVSYGLRGMQAFLVTLQTGGYDVHSGEVGGLARNPITELAGLIAECVDAKTGKVKIPGFYDAVRKTSEEELDDFIKSGFELEDFAKKRDLYSLRTNDVRDGVARVWTQPTFEVHGITGGYSGPGVKTIVPHKAEAKISMRLVPDQDPEKITKLFVDFVNQKCPDAKVEVKGALKPYLGDREGKFPDAARKAFKLAFDKEAAFVREGGSIGAVVTMQELLQVPIMFLGLSLPEHGYHAINENFDWGQASAGMKLFVHYFKLLAEIK